MVLTQQHNLLELQPLPSSDGKDGLLRNGLIEGFPRESVSPSICLMKRDWDPALSGGLSMPMQETPGLRVVHLLKGSPVLAEEELGTHNQTRLRGTKKKLEGVAEWRGLSR